MEDRGRRVRLRNAGFLYLIVTVLYLGLGRLFNRFWGADESALRVLIVQLGILFVPTLVYLFLRKRPLPSFRAPLKRALETMLLAVLLMVALLSFNALWLALLSLCGWSIQASTLPIPATGFELFRSLLTMALLPAVMEELLFRGALLQDMDPLSAKPYGRLKSVCFVALAFSLLHVDLQGLPGRFFLGLMLGLLYFWNRKRLGLSMAYHFANNAFVFVLLMLLSGSAASVVPQSPEELNALLVGDIGADALQALGPEWEALMSEYLSLLQRIPMGLIFLMSGLLSLPTALAAALGAWCLIQRLRRDVPPWEDPLGDWGRGRLFRVLPAAHYTGFETPPPQEPSTQASEKPPSLLRRYSWLYPWLLAWSLMASYYWVGWL